MAAISRWRLALLGAGLVLVAGGLWMARSELAESAAAIESFNESCPSGGWRSQLQRCATLDAVQSGSKREAVLGAFVAGLGLAAGIRAAALPPLARAPRILLGPLGFLLTFLGLILPIGDARLAPMGPEARCDGVVYSSGYVICGEPIPPLPADLLGAVGVVVISGAMFGIGVFVIGAMLPPRSRPSSLDRPPPNL